MIPSERSGNTCRELIRFDLPEQHTARTAAAAPQIDANGSVRTTRRVHINEDHIE
jgi:hypothetical protein